MRIYTVDDFIYKSKFLFGSHYDYTLLDYKNNRTQVKLKCNLCSNIFLIRPDSHFVSPSGGCLKCQPQRAGSRENKGITVEEFIAKANEIHNNKYDYSFIEFRILSDILNIKCEEHGFFKQTGSKHITDRHGCTECGRIKRANALRSNIDELIVRFKKIHKDKYNYDKFTYYKNNQTKINIFCNKHKKYFKQSVGKHLQSQDCPLCSIGVSKVEIEWLDYLQIPLEFRNKCLKINGRNFKPDAIDKINKIIWEFDGDFWHGNPSVFNPNDIGKNCKITFGEKYRKTLEKQQFLESAGYTVISIWESDFNVLKKTFITKDSPASDSEALSDPPPLLQDHQSPDP